MDGLEETKGVLLSLQCDNGVGDDDPDDNGECQVLCVQSSVVYGHVGNRVASFFLQVCGGFFFFFKGASPHQEKTNKQTNKQKTVDMCNGQCQAV